MTPPPLFSISLPMTIPVALRRNVQQRRLTVGHRDANNPRRGFELINVAANFRFRKSLTVTGRLGHPALRHRRT
jgi:hypothetical protein